MKTNIFAPFWTILVLLCLPAAPLSADEFGLFTYEVFGNTVEITDYPEDAVGEVEIPAEIDGNVVTGIGGGAFSGCTKVTSITIPSSVTGMGVGAFSSCAALTSIHVDSGNPNYSSIDGVLLNAEQTWLIRCPPGRAGNYSIPLGISRIVGYKIVWFSNDGDTDVPGAFMNCSALTSIAIPPSVTDIGDTAFAGCSSLTGITIPKAVTSIGYDAFSQCSSLLSIDVGIGNPEYSSVEGVLFDAAQTTLIRCPQGKTGAYTIPEGVIRMGLEWGVDGAFQDCSGLTSVAIPGSVTAIGGRAFSGCTGLTIVNIPSSVTRIDWSAFSGCIGLTNVTIPSSVTRIDQSAFSDCVGLTNVTIPSSVTSIGGGAFSGCSALETAVFFGNAPTSFHLNVFAWTAPDFTIYYLSGSEGFSSPTWRGYPATEIYDLDGLKGFDIVDVTKTDGSVTITFRSTPGRSYAINASDDLQTWVELSDEVKGAADSGTTSFTESPLPEGSGTRYYRVRRQ